MAKKKTDKADTKKKGNGATDAKGARTSFILYKADGS